MKNLLLSLSIILFISEFVFSQSGSVAVLEKLEQTDQNTVVAGTTATLKSASRLFGEKDDLTAVILVIPTGSSVDVLGSDSTYVHVVYDGTEGYIFNKNLTINQAVSKPVPVPVATQIQVTQPQVSNIQTNNQAESRYSILESKYGTSIATRLYSGKVWKGMSTEMVTDSWGTPEKINRSISSSIVKEEWIYRNTWLFFESDRLIEWGPVNR